ncbi:hypothetical protein CCMSSC00406_0008999 [Pleurotus cornucopiae]|uniref:Uncharacterized protein n=1 Tax=Pleurotus cornucopiae TaxID=5321 RepID=A0ACB7J938_PLECO|nr:hypothetical protein CCMSSC00406_0008999 [Pleurotus cornucopiae]
MAGEGRSNPADADGDNPLEGRVVGLESSVKEILELLRAAASVPQPPPAPPVPTTPAAPVAPPAQATQLAPPLISYVPPATTNVSAGALSIPDFFPDVDAAVVASIGKHEFRPQQLGKLIPSVTSKPTTTTYALEDGALRATETAPIKDLPDFSSFMRALGVYFQILYRYVGTTGNVQAVIDVAVSTQSYANLLHEYSRYFSYPAILTYHIAHHSRRIREMIRGDYSLWGDEDRALVGPLHRSNMNQDVKASSSSARDVSAQTCNKFNDGKCPTTPCKSGRTHKTRALPLASSPRPCQQDEPRIPTHSALNLAASTTPLIPDPLSLFAPGPLPPARPNTDPRCNHASLRAHNEVPVKSTLVYSKWAYYLADYPDSQLVQALLHIIKYGAAIGFTGDDKPQTCRNLKTAIEHPDVIDKDMNVLSSNDRIHGPLSSPPHPAFRASPLGTVTRKRFPNKFRVINHLSWPPGDSVNDGIPDDEAHIVYKAVFQAIRSIRRMGRGALLAKLDLKDAFRHIPLRVTDYHLIGCMWDNKFYEYMVLIFGLKSAPYIFNLFAEALHWIIQRHIPADLKHYLDDFLPIFSPDTPLTLANDAITWIQALGGSLGLTFQPEKTVWPTTCLEFLGIELDTLAMEARLPNNKLVYLNELLASWSTKCHCNLHEVQELTGFLHFSSQVIPYSRAFLRRLTQFSTTFSTPHSRRHIPRCARSDLRWWQTYASLWNGVTLIDPPASHHHVFTDASGTKGLGGIYNNHWFSARVPRRFRGSKRDIQFKELYAVLQAILRWGHLWRHSQVHFHVDNQAAAASRTHACCHVGIFLFFFLALLL